MKLDLGSFAFGSFLPVGGSPSWGTALGQGKGLKFSYPGWDNIIAGMLYKAIPTSKVYIPLGKGGHVYNGLDDEEVAKYILHKINLAGASSKIIDTAALSAAHSYTQGNPRLIDNLMTDAITIGSQRKSKVIDADIIHDAVENQVLG